MKYQEKKNRAAAARATRSRNQIRCARICLESSLKGMRMMACSVPDGRLEVMTQA